MKRQIITIDEDKCNGCGNCVTGCPEGAIQMINGKARLINDLFCDGLGACIGECPVDAITIEVREAAPYNERLVMENIIPHGIDTIKAHLKHLHEHNEKGFLAEAIAYLEEKGIPVPEYIEEKQSSGCGGGCPGSASFSFRDDPAAPVNHGSSFANVSQLSQWPVQLKLLNPEAPFFQEEGLELLIAADCAPMAHANFHEEFMKGKKLAMFCPKLDPYTEEYRDKLAHIFRYGDVKSVTIARMEVPCCGGIGMIVKQAMELSGRSIPVEEKIIKIK